jgi:hypothetical protein
VSAKLTASEARQNFSDILNRAAYGGERVIVHRECESFKEKRTIGGYEWATTQSFVAWRSGES